jgi:hypothetical protein
MDISPLKLNEPVLWKAVHRGIEYNGEAILASSWRAELGRKIEVEDIHFRIVTLTHPQPIPLEELQEPRLAVCLPAVPRQRLGEQRAAYLTKGEEARAIPEMVMEFYAEGSIVCQNPLPIAAEEVFSAPDIMASLNLIASTLLATVYPTLSIDTSALKRPLTAEDIGLVFDGFFSPQEKPEAKKALEDFAIALGLAQAHNPYKFAPQGCPLFPIIISELERHSGNLLITKLYQGLKTQGLTNPLITLYLLCLVRYGEPAVELQLKPQHGLVLRSRKRFPHDKLTPPYVAELRWSGELWRNWESLRYSPEPLWNVALPYAQEIEQALRAISETEELRGQGDLLLRKLKELGRIRNTLETMATAWETTPQGEVLAAVERLSHLGQCKGYRDFYQIVHEEYKAPSALTEDMSLYQRLSQLAQSTPEILRVKAYLEKLELRESDDELIMDRLSILEQLNLSNLLSAPHLWFSIEALFRWFRQRYDAIYQAHHYSCNQEFASLYSSLLESEAKLEALQKLNSIAELGPPLAEGLQKEYQPLLIKVKPCPVTGRKVSLEEQPICPHCGLSLRAIAPKDEVEHFLSLLEQALREQQHRLSTKAIRQILSQSKEHRMDRFVKILQTSDLSSLVNVLDDELVDFLRHLLSEAQTITLRYPMLKALSQKFPFIEEEQIEGVLSEFATGLKKAFEQAKRENPGKRIRIILE